MGRTIVCDVDGVIFKHRGLHPDGWTSEPRELIPGVRDQFADWWAEGAHVVLMTAQPECWRERLKQDLLDAQLYFHQLVMGVGDGERVLINDNGAKAQLAIERNLAEGDLVRVTDDGYVGIGKVVNRVEGFYEVRLPTNTVRRYEPHKLRRLSEAEVRHYKSYGGTL